MNIRSSVVFLSLLLSVYTMWGSGAQAGPAAEMLRASIASLALEKTKAVSPRALRIYKSRCDPLYATIKRLHQKHSCSGRCDEKIKTYDVALNEHWMITQAFSLRMKPIETYKNGLSPSAALRICFRIAIKEKDHIATYGVGRMLSQSEHYQDRFVGGLWAYTALGLGKGVPKSKRLGIKRLTELSEAKEATVKAKVLLFSLIAKEEADK